MPLHFSPLRGFPLFLLFFGLALLTPLAADKKHKATEAEAKSKPKVKTTQKADPKQQAKAIRDSLLAQKKNKQEDDRKGNKRDEATNKIAAKLREEKTNKKSHGKETAATGKADKKNDQTSDRLAKREAEKKNGKAKDQLAKREADKKSGKQEVAAKKSQAEKDTKSSKVSKKDVEITEAKAKVNTKANKQDSKAALDSKGLAKSEKAASNPKQLAKTDRSPEAKADGKIKDLPPGNFTLRPITKAVPKVELKFSLARAAAITTFDAPPPRDNGPDVIDVIEYDSPETKRLDDLFRSEMKIVRFSSVPSVSRKKLDVGKMDAERIKQIQECLAKKGYYLGEISGQYNEATIEAMRKFQEEHRVDVTGYATAQSLKLLGLTDW